MPHVGRHRPLHDRIVVRVLTRFVQKCRVDGASGHAGHALGSTKSVGSNGETVFRLKGERAFEVDFWTFNRRCRLFDPTDFGASNFKRAPSAVLAPLADSLTDLIERFEEWSFPYRRETGSPTTTTHIVPPGRPRKQASGPGW